MRTPILFVCLLLLCPVFFATTAADFLQAVKDYETQYTDFKVLAHAYWDSDYVVYGRDQRLREEGRDYYLQATSAMLTYLSYVKSEVDFDPGISSGQRSAYDQQLQVYQNVLAQTNTRLKGASKKSQIVQATTTLTPDWTALKEKGNEMLVVAGTGEAKALLNKEKIIAAELEEKVNASTVLNSQERQRFAQLFSELKPLLTQAETSIANAEVTHSVSSLTTVQARLASGKAKLIEIKNLMESIRR